MNNKMYKDEEILSFMDLLDLDEEVIDLRVQSLMKKDKVSNKQLENLVHLFQYKHLINVREDSECENEEEYNFLVKLILNANNDNVEAICTIINLVLTLNLSSIVYKSEHLLQQILSDIYLPPLQIEGDGEREELQTTIICLKMCGSILNALKKIETKLSLPFLDCPLEQIICSRDKELEVYFLRYSVPQFFELINGFNILDRIWNFLKQLNDSSIALKVICCLSNYYLPILEKSDSTVLESGIIEDYGFWNFILDGLMCMEQGLSLRKQSIYLAKRAIDYAVINKKNINIYSNTTFIWSCKDENTLKKMWDNYFILLDSLEEKQSNIVLPSLKLFESIKDIGHCWVIAAFNIGLKHDNSQVRLKCLLYRFQYKISNRIEAITILEVINDLSLFEYININNSIIEQLHKALSDVETLIYILQGTSLVKWSPVPLYSLTSCLSELLVLIKDSDQKIVIDTLNRILKIPCNNIVIRRAIHINISHFIAKCLKILPWREYIGIYPLLEIEYTNTVNTFVNFVQNDMTVPEDDVQQLLDVLTSSYGNIQFALIYFRNRNETRFLNIICNMIDKIQNISSRQYSNKLDCLNDAIFVTHIFKFQKETIVGKINSITAFKAILQYIVSLISSEVQLDIDRINLLLEGFEYIINCVNIFDYNETLIQIYKSANLLLKDSKTDLQKKLFALCTINVLLKSSINSHCAKEVVLHETLANMKQNLQISECNILNGGRSRNTFYEKLCEVLYTLSEDANIKDMTSFIDVLLECGGYGCLKWILKITNKIITKILDQDIKFDLAQFLCRIWKEIEELKSNNQYSTCIEQFIILITQDALLKRSIYNDVVFLYFSKILNYAAIKFTPLHFLVKQLTIINNSNYKHMVNFICEILLYANIPNKEQRIADKIEVKILEQPICYGIDYKSVQFNAHIQYLAVSILSKIHDNALLNTLMSCVKKRIEDLLKNKVRYHENSYLERSIEAGLQCLLIIVLKTRDVDIRGTAFWCVEFLGRMPHQPYVKICLEWYISLYFYLEKCVMDEKMLHQLKSRNVPLLSQFKILYWIVISKIQTATCMQSEFDFVMEILTSHSMGPTYTVRIYAQYLSTGILNAMTNENYTQKYSFISKVMNNCLSDAAKLKEKSFMTLLDDYFIHGFGIIRDLSFSGIYYSLPPSARALSVNKNDHNIFTKYFLSEIAKDINKSLSVDLKDEFLDMFGKGFLVPIKRDNEMISRVINEVEESQTIQKKYVPWKTMSNIDVYNTEERTKSDLILMASLIDKLPNLGGMARTGEVFGVHTYVVDSFRHLQSKVFQDLSVSAERWVNVEEVRLGEPLKEYLMLKKSEGYTIVAAEQTSNSVKLQDYKFPKKTLLILGYGFLLIGLHIFRTFISFYNELRNQTHICIVLQKIRVSLLLMLKLNDFRHEKEGISCDLLPLMDHCVEIPQRGVIRSLNVHVTAAIFVWEYTRQYML